MIGYTNTIRKWATDNRRTGALADADGTGEVGLDQEAGSRLAVRFTLKLEMERITDIRYQVFGCGFSMAACAVAADMSVGYSLQQMTAIDSQSINHALEGLPEDRLYCADLAAEALRAAVASAQNDHQPIRGAVRNQEIHDSQVTVNDPVYAGLINSSNPLDKADEDRHLFACLLAVAVQDEHKTCEALGLTDSDLSALLKKFFPCAEPDLLQKHNKAEFLNPPEINEEVLGILLEHVPTTLGPYDNLVSVSLCHILAARAALPGHLWVAMGLFERPELTAAIRRHLPTLTEANSQNMRWKRYLFKQVCDRNGGTMCKSPNCGVCSDYAICFTDED
jgi:nitrogen fixation protein NifQ